MKYTEKIKKFFQDKAGRVASVTQGYVEKLLVAIIILVIGGNSSVITLVTNAFTALCNSGFPLAGLLDPSSGIAPMMYIIGLFLFAIVAFLAVGKGTK